MCLLKWFYVFQICYSIRKIQIILKERKLFLILQWSLNVWHICEQTERISEPCLLIDLLPQCELLINSLGWGKIRMEYDFRWERGNRAWFSFLGIFRSRCKSSKSWFLTPNSEMRIFALDGVGEGYSVP